ncbi:MAG: Ig-like domain-containing protein [Anaerolineae bacterium]
MKSFVRFGLGALLLFNLILAGTALADRPADTPAQQSTPTPAGGPPHVHIVKPAENGVVSISEFPIVVTADNLPANTDAQWQFYIDGKPAGSATGAAITYTLSITVSGPHTIQAALAGPGGSELASAAVNVTAAPRTPDAAFNVSNMGPVMAVLTIGIFLLIIFSVRLTRRPAVR